MLIIAAVALADFWPAVAPAQAQNGQDAAASPPAHPLPRPEPDTIPDPAGKRIRAGESLVLPLPYAPTVSGPEPLQAGESELVVEARLADGFPPLAGDVVWRVFGSSANADGSLPLVATAAGGTTSFWLAGGTYYLHAAYGRAGAVKRVDMRGKPASASLSLNAGGLRLTAVVGEDRPAKPENVAYEIYMENEQGERLQLIEDASEEAVLRLNAGTYHVVSRYGTVNAVVRADIQVNAGKLTEATIRHKGAEVTLKLVEEEGGEALANTQWTVVTPAGDILYEAVGAFPSIILAEGTYTVFAGHGDQNYSRDFEVEAGIDRDLEVRLADLNIETTGMRPDD